MTIVCDRRLSGISSTRLQTAGERCLPTMHKSLCRIVGPSLLTSAPYRRVSKTPQILRPALLRQLRRRQHLRQHLEDTNDPNIQSSKHVEVSETVDDRWHRVSGRPAPLFTAG